MAQKKFRTYTRLVSKLNRSGIKKPGPTATLLIQAFVECGGVIKAAQAEGKNLCKKNGFTAWRKTLEDADYLIPWKFGDYSQHQAGPKLAKLINEEIQSQYVVATQKDLNMAKSELHSKISILEKENVEIRAKNANISAGIERILNLIDPPSDSKKVNNLLNGDYDKKFLSLVKDKEETPEAIRSI